VICEFRRRVNLELPVPSVELLSFFFRVGVSGGNLNRTCPVGLYNLQEQKTPNSCDGTNCYSGVGGGPQSKKRRWAILSQYNRKV
jgi:hypothetical protein